jgi:signal transduction histidine kinase
MNKTITDIRQRFAALDPRLLDIALAVGLTLLACAQIWLFDALRSATAPLPRGPFVVRELPPGSGLLAYAIVAGVFLPLAFRRVSPWVALALSTGFAAAYAIHPLPPTFTVLGPMVAIYSLAAFSTKRQSGFVALFVAGMIAAVPLIAFSSDRWIAQAVGTFALIAAAMLLGEAARNRRAYIAEVEQRAFEAERTREEEALRRVDEERIRIAREVHDIVAHSLSIVTVQASAAATLLDTDPDRARESVEHIRATSKEALGELRSMLDVLRTGDAGVPMAPTADITEIERLVRPVQDSGLAVNLAVHGDLATVPAFASVSAYRIVQEALTNTVRHAKATSVRVALAIVAGRLEIEIMDDGTGPDEQYGGPAESNGHGLRGMRERIDALGGTLVAGPAPSGSGFRVYAMIPLSRSAS